MALAISYREAGWIAFENEVEASRWALHLMRAHVERMEADLEAERHARRLAENRAELLERTLVVFARKA